MITGELNTRSKLARTRSILEEVTENASSDSQSTQRSPVAGEFNNYESFVEELKRIPFKEFYDPIETTHITSILSYFAYLFNFAAASEFSDFQNQRYISIMVSLFLTTQEPEILQSLSENLAQYPYSAKSIEEVYTSQLYNRLIDNISAPDPKLSQMCQHALCNCLASSNAWYQVPIERWISCMEAFTSPSLFAWFVSIAVHKKLPANTVPLLVDKLFWASSEDPHNQSLVQDVFSSLETLMNGILSSEDISTISALFTPKYLKLITDHLDDHSVCRSVGETLKGLIRKGIDPGLIFTETTICRIDSILQSLPDDILRWSCIDFLEFAVTYDAWDIDTDIVRRIFDIAVEGNIREKKAAISFACAFIQRLEDAPRSSEDDGFYISSIRPDFMGEIFAYACEADSTIQIDVLSCISKLLYSNPDLIQHAMDSPDFDQFLELLDEIEDTENTDISGLASVIKRQMEIQ